MEKQCHLSNTKANINANFTKNTYHKGVNLCDRWRPYFVLNHVCLCALFYIHPNAHKYILAVFDQSVWVSHSDWEWWLCIYARLCTIYRMIFTYLTLFLFVLSLNMYSFRTCLCRSSDSFFHILVERLFKYNDIWLLLILLHKLSLYCACIYTIEKSVRRAEKTQHVARKKIKPYGTE